MQPVYFIAAFLLAIAPSGANAQTVVGRAAVSVPYGSGAGGAAAQSRPSTSLVAPAPLGNISFGALRDAASPKVQGKASPAAAVAAVSMPAAEAPVKLLYKEEAGFKSPEGSGETLAGLIDKVKTADDKPAGDVFSAGHSIMDRIIGVKPRPASSVMDRDVPIQYPSDAGRVDPGEVLGSQGAAPSTKALPLSRPSLEAPRAAAVSPVENASSLGGFAQKAAMFGIGAFSLAGTIAAVNPLIAVAVYVTMIIPSLILHEMGHAKVAEVLGDGKIREAGRLSFTVEGLKTHFDLTSTLLLPAVTLWASSGAMLLGAAKPLEIHYGHFARPIRDMAKVAVAGPVVHVLLALAGASAFGLAAAAGIGGFVATALALFAYYNVTLALINLLPIFPADANHILRAALHAVSPAWVAALDGFYVSLGRFNRLPLWIAIAALSLTGVFKAAALAVAGAFLSHAALAAAALALSAAAIFVVLRRGLL